MNIAYIISSILAFVFFCIVAGGAVVGAKYAAIYFVVRVIIQLVKQMNAAKPAPRFAY
jgi:hypothetical protein